MHLLLLRSSPIISTCFRKQGGTHLQLPTTHYQLASAGHHIPVYKCENVKQKVEKQNSGNANLFWANGNIMFISHLLLPTSYPLIFLVMTVQIATSVNMLKPNPLILLPRLATPFNHDPSRNCPNLKHQPNRTMTSSQIDMKS